MGFSLEDFKAYGRCAEEAMKAGIFWTSTGV
jgi:hypothetical protein